MTPQEQSSPQTQARPNNYTSYIVDIQLWYFQYNFLVWYQIFWGFSQRKNLW